MDDDEIQSIKGENLAFAPTPDFVMAFAAFSLSSSLSDAFAG